MRADFESHHQTDPSAWHLKPSVFKKLTKVLGECNIDLFASYRNTQLISDVPRLLPSDQSLVTDPLGRPHLLQVQQRLNLVAWKSLEAQGISGEAANLYCALSSHKSCWERWINWCSSKQANASVGEIDSFLTELFNEGKELEYSTINSNSY